MQQPNSIQIVPDTNQIERVVPDTEQVKNPTTVTERFCCCILETFNCCNISRILGRGYGLLFIFVLSSLKSDRKHTLPFFFGRMNVGLPHSDSTCRTEIFEIFWAYAKTFYTFQELSKSKMETCPLQ